MYAAAGICAVLLTAFLILPPAIVHTKKYSIYTDAESITPQETGIVFGAGVTSDMRPTRMLRERLDTAIDLYEHEKIQTLIVSGDNRSSHYNEPEVMAQYLISAGIPEDVIILDTAGLRTYDTCYRAENVFNIDTALLITHGYHLPRGLYLCSSFGIVSSGFSATQRTSYPAETFYKLREIAAIYRSVLDITIIKPTPDGEME
mgnify:CR=1 FL=1